jgi:hypothetical protein
MTLACPTCGGQLVVRVRLPRPEHRDTKRPDVLGFECTTRDCNITEADVHNAIGF